MLILRSAPRNWVFLPLFGRICGASAFHWAPSSSVPVAQQQQVPRTHSCAAVPGVATPQNSEAAEASATAKAKAHFTRHGELSIGGIHPPRYLATVPNQAAPVFQNSVRREDTRLPWRTEHCHELRNISIQCAGPQRCLPAVKGCTDALVGRRYGRVLGTSCRNRHLGYKTDGLRGQGYRK